MGTEPLVVALRAIGSYPEEKRERAKSGYGVEDRDYGLRYTRLLQRGVYISHGLVPAHNTDKYASYRSDLWELFDRTENSFGLCHLDSLQLSTVQPFQP